MAKFIEIMGSGGLSKVVLNVNQITSVKASTTGCTVRLTEGDSISTKTPYEEIKQAIEDACAVSSQIYSIVDEGAQDAIPRGPIVIT